MKINKLFKIEHLAQEFNELEAYNPLKNDFKGLLKGHIDASKWKIENLKRKIQSTEM